ncbi:putative inactive cytochrome P450 2G1 [Haliotis rufescens]|uniref:putative inactive cytochrome P450 2G1 n=1 Tax=Haliotis rufescens TaxID=6454 RepID=UPI00201F9B5B|nr:putative inactive cytochrome P450 2G1 [Haliotis rufescens]
MTGTRLDQGIECSLTKGTELIQEMKGPFNPHHVVSLIVFNIINNICFSVTCDVHDNYFKEMLYFLNSFLNIGNGFLEDVIPPLRLFHTQKLKTLMKDTEKFFGRALGGCHFPSVSDRSDLPYTDAVLHESMRLHTVAPSGIPHKTLCDTKVGGYDIPRGTTVLINHYGLHRDPEQWRDPQVYNPDRFLDHEGKVATKPESWLPFSAGRRVCLRESVAKPELHLLLAGIMRHFKVSLPPGAKVNLEPRGGSFVNVPHDYELSFESRL